MSFNLSSATANMLCTLPTDISLTTLPGTDLQTLQNSIQVSPFWCWSMFAIFFGCTCWVLNKLQRKMCAKPELNGIENTFGQLAHEAKWTSEAKWIASNVRNAFHQEVRYFLQPSHHLHFSLIVRSEIASLARNDAQLNSSQLSLAYVIDRG